MTTERDPLRPCPECGETHYGHLGSCSQYIPDDDDIAALHRLRDAERWLRDCHAAELAAATEEERIRATGTTARARVAYDEASQGAGCLRRDLIPQQTGVS